MFLWVDIRRVWHRGDLRICLPYDWLDLRLYQLWWVLKTYQMPKRNRKLAKEMHQPRIERGAHRWQRWILPLNHWCLVEICSSSRCWWLRELVIPLMSDGCLLQTITDWLGMLSGLLGVAPLDRGWSSLDGVEVEHWCSHYHGYTAGGYFGWMPCPIFV